jgi:hypothetical protein
MKKMKTKIAVVALSGAIAGGVMAAPAFGASGPNDGGANCHGVVLSYQSTSDMAPGQLQKSAGTSVKDIQASADVLCSL